MALGILFKMIPWGEVLAATPAMVDGAKKLWTLARERNTPGDAADATLPVGDRLRVLQAQFDELERELAASAELIKRLAEQNAQLVAAIDVMRKRTRTALIAGFVALSAIAAAVAWLQFAR